MLSPLTVTLRSVGAAPAAPTASVVVSISISRKIFQRIIDSLHPSLREDVRYRLFCASSVRMITKPGGALFVRLWTIAFGAQQFILAAILTRKQPYHAPRRRTRKQQRGRHARRRRFRPGKGPGRRHDPDRACRVVC